MTSQTLLLRQVNPSWIQQGRITSQLFVPTKKDANRPSVYDGDQITPEKSWQHYTGVLLFASVGVVAVTFQECQDEGLPPALDPRPDFPEHAVIDFSGCTSNGEIRRKADTLRNKAVTRGWLYQAEV